jgi:hypothetical protein
MPEEGPPVHPRHVEVEHDDGRAKPRPQELHRFLAVAGDDDRVASRRKQVRDRRALISVVLDHEDREARGTTA